MVKRIAVLTSGGDSQGMNACIKAIVNACISHKVEIIGVMRGFQGLLDNDYIKLTNEMVEHIGFLGGTILKTSRCEEFKKSSGVDKAIKNMRKNKIDGLIVLGGNGSLRGVQELAEKGFNVVGIPASIDNDTFYSNSSLGFDTAIKNAVEAVENVRQTASATDRAMVIQTMGRECGEIALHTAFISNADAFDCKELKAGIKGIVLEVKNALKTGVKSPIIVISEGVDYSVEDVRKEIEKFLKIEARTQILGYIQRGGSPSMYDRRLAKEFGVEAVKLLLAGVGGKAIGIKNSKIFSMNIEEANSTPQIFRKDIYDRMKYLKNM